MTIELDLSPLDDVKRAVAEAQQKMQESSKAALREGFKTIFDAYGNILGEVVWTQYTPYFNDGDVCEFGVGEIICRTPSDVAAIQSGEQEDTAWEDGEEFYRLSRTSKYVQRDGRYTSVPNPDYNRAYEECRSQVVALLRAIPEDALKATLGDHALVKVTREGVTVEEYEHD